MAKVKQTARKSTGANAKLLSQKTMLNRKLQTKKSQKISISSDSGTSIVKTPKKKKQFRRRP
uniref:Uncharacterized protein n=1 Tax=Romanomermis culicivorax TaxID=13658 RepID=A0A915HLJ5_ROMCU